MSYNLERTKRLLTVYDAFIDGKRIEVISEHVGIWQECGQIPLSNDWNLQVVGGSPSDYHYAQCSGDYKRAIWDARELLQAFVNGKPMEYLNPSTGWQPVSQDGAQSWDFINHKWRIVGNEDGQPYLADFYKGDKIRGDKNGG